MDISNLTAKAKRGLAIAGIAGNIAAIPLTKDTTPDLAKQYTQYAKDVRLPETARQRSRQIAKTQHPVPTLDKRTTKRLTRR